MKKETVPYLKRSFTMLMVLWTFTIVLIFYLSFISEKKTVFNLAAHQSRASFDKDIQYRLWATRHGGVYVPQTENTPPNPDLANIPERDITTPSGRKLTLMNPAYMTRQVFEISKERFGYIGHITSLNPLRKENAADEWEKRSLTSFARGVKEVIEITDFNGEPHVRFMAPFITEKGCLKCHESQGYKVGDIRGGISISFPLQPFDEMFWSNMQGNILSLIGIWLTGMGGLFFAFKKMQVTIAEKEQLNEEVKNNERMLNSLLNGIKESALLIDVKGKVLAANDTVDDRINNGHRDIVGKNVYDLLDSDVAKGRQKYVEELIRTGKALQFEDVRNNRVISNSISPVLESNGIISKIALIGYDITDQRKNALALMETEERFTLAMKASNDGLFDWNLLTNEIYYSPSWKNILGYEDHELPNDFSVWEANTDHEDVQRSWELQQKLISRQIDRFVMEFKMKHKDGNWVDILSRAEAFFDETGKAVRIIGTHTDITERKRAEKILQQAEQRLRLANKATSDVIWDWDVLTDLQQWNEAGTRIFGWTEIVERQVNAEWWVQRVHADDRQRVHDSFFTVLHNPNSDVWHDEYRFLKADGTYADVLDRGYVLRNEQGNAIRMVGAMLNITERKLAEIELEKHRNHLEELVKVRTKELEQANESLKKVVDKEKELNELKSRFLSTTSHEFRTPLTSILSSTELLQRFGIKWSAEKKEEHYNRIIASVEYLTKLLDDILTLNRAESGKISYQPETVNLHDLSKECLIDAKLLMNDIHEPMFNYTSMKKEFQLDPKLMKFVLNNLLSNAAKYSPQGGKVELNISTDKKHILIEVIDEGIGIPPEDIQKIYDAFYRTKTANEIAGTGLGLAIVKRAVDLHSGEIKVESKLGEGTRFLVQIPILESK